NGSGGRCGRDGGISRSGVPVKPSGAHPCLVADASVPSLVARIFLRSGAPSPRRRCTMAEPKTPPPPTDAELDTYIRTRYALLGIDISVLPVDDAKAVMDQKRLLANGRDILRQEVTAADF